MIIQLSIISHKGDHKYIIPSFEVDTILFEGRHIKSSISSECLSKENLQLTIISFLVEMIENILIYNLPLA